VAQKIDITDHAPLMLPVCAGKDHGILTRTSNARDLTGARRRSRNSGPSLRSMPNPRRIMIIEDDPDIARMLELNLRNEGFSVTVAHDGESGLAGLARTRYDLLVLDLMLPGIDGLSICPKYAS
jgi:PleD family two-component response regulator